MSPFLVARDDGLEHLLPVIGAVNVARPKRASFEIAELVEDEERMVTSAAEMAVPDALLLLAMGRAHARVHVQHDHRRPIGACATDRSIGRTDRQERERFSGAASHCVSNRPIWLGDAARAFRCFAADDPTHRWIVTQPLGIVHILVSGEAAENRLPQHADQRMTTVLAGACVGEQFAGRFAQAECIIEFAIGEQTCIGGDDGATKLHRHAAVKIEVARTSFCASPVGFVTCGSHNQRKSLVNYSKYASRRSRFGDSSGECGIKPSPALRLPRLNDRQRYCLQIVWKMKRASAPSFARMCALPFFNYPCRR